MKTAFCLGSALVVALLAVSVTSAGDVEVKGHPKITISGQVDLRGVFRNDDLMDINGDILRRPSGATSSHGDFYLDPDMIVNIDIEGSKTPLWNARLSLKTPQWVADDFGSQLREVSVSEAYLELPEIMFEGASLKAGIMTYSTDVRKNGQSFLFDPHESESAFLNRFGNVAGNPLVIPPPGGVPIPVGSNGNGVVASTGTSTSPGAFAEGVGPGSSTGEANTLEPAGILGSYKLKHITLEAFYFNLLELRDFGGGDEVAFGGIATYDLQERGRLQALYIGFENDSSSHIHNLGFGGSFKPIHGKGTGDLEAYGEFVYQFGKFATNVPDLATAGGSLRDLKQDSFAAYAGVNYSFKVANFSPGFDASYWFVKGDNSPGGNTNNDFVSYENIDDTLIVEENNYGLDIDTNYEALKFRFNLGWNLNTEDEVENDLVFSILYALFHQEQSERNQPEKIGDEIDVSVLWNYSPNLKFFAAAGWLFDARAINHGHKVTGTAGAPEGNDLAIFTFGTTLSF